jgi:uncharacterized protein YecT (DUF1311 family)
MIVSLIFATAMTASMPSSATSAALSCQDAFTTQEMIHCAGLNAMAADDELNEVYKKLKASLSPNQQWRLVKSERRWLKQLEPRCKESTDDEVGTGSMWQQVNLQCIADATKMRTIELQRWKPGAP